jgi:hypothetical protein
VQPEKTVREETAPEPAAEKRLFWSAATRTPAGAGPSDDVAESIAVPLELRSFEKCKACGFPVSRGRTFCVECEEKQWRGQSLPQPAANASSKPHPQETAHGEVAIGAAAIGAAVGGDLPKSVPPDVVVQNVVLQNVPEDVSTSENSTLLLSSTAPSESWFAANKYVLGALLAIVIVIVAIAWLR